MRKVFFALVMVTLMVGSAFAGELLINGDFESGELPPWSNARDFCGSICVPWDTTTTVVHSGMFSATDTGNIELRQDFAPTLGSDITGVSLWVNNSVGVNAVDFFYTDSSIEEFVFFTTADTWNFVDLLSDVNTSKTLSGISFWGCDPDCVTYLDDISVTTGATTAEPSSLLMLGSGVLAVAGAFRRKLRF
jgi:hypothetical protein